MGRAGMFFSTVAIAAGAILYWAVTSTEHGFRLSTVGGILMVVGVIGLITSMTIFATSRPGSVGRRRTYDRQAVDVHGQITELHEEVS